MTYKVVKPVKKAQKTLDQLFKAPPPATVRKVVKAQTHVHPETKVKEAAVDAKPTNTSFNKAKWVATLTPEQRKYLELEINNIPDEWLSLAHQEFTKDYFMNLKKFLEAEKAKNKTIFPPPENIYSFTKYCPDLSKVKVLILGQDPYHNFNQAHGLAFSVLCPQLPPSLRNIYKGVQIDYPDFKIPKKNGNLTSWSEQGVLLLNTCLTVEAHKANSHNGKGWEQFTSALITNLINHKNKVMDKEIVILAWGSFAINLIKNKINLTRLNSQNNKNNLLLTSVHPSPLSASRGFFQGHHFEKSNEWISKAYGPEHMIDWTRIKDE